jgi:hypothetical protein
MIINNSGCKKYTYIIKVGKLSGYGIRIETIADPKTCPVYSKSLVE